MVQTLTPAQPTNSAIAALWHILRLPKDTQHGPFNTNRETPRTIAPVVRKFKLTKQPSDFAYWQTQSHEARLAARKEIRREYYGYTDETEPRVERDVTIVKLNKQASGRLKDSVALESLD